MAKSRQKRKKVRSNLQLKTKAKLAIFIVATILSALALVLDKSGIFTYHDVQVMMGSADETVDTKKADTKVHFIDVGQGDSTLIISDDKTMLVDCGDRDSDNRVIKYIQNLGIQKLDIIVATHPHADHIGEMSEIIDEFDVGKFIMLKVPDKQVPTSKIYENMLKSIKAKGLKITSSKDESFELGSCQIDTFTPKEEYSDLNNYSILVKVTHGDNSFLITGDCESAEEKEMIKAGFDLSAKVLKAGHHGSSTSSSQKFLEEVLPRYVVISVGDDNKYGHPHDVTVNRLKKYAENMYKTNEDGDVVFISDGKGLEIKTSEADSVKTSK